MQWNETKKSLVNVLDYIVGFYAEAFRFVAICKLKPKTNHILLIGFK
jgi:hypothetical protein